MRVLRSAASGDGNADPADSPSDVERGGVRVFVGAAHGDDTGDTEGDGADDFDQHDGP